MKIYIGNINEYTEGQLSSLVAKERIKQSMKYRFEADRKRSLMAHTLLNHAVSVEYPDVPLPVMPVTDEFGKPHLLIKGDSNEGSALSGLHFSLSHSGDYAVCAVNDAPVGVDIEVIGKEAENIARRFFAPEELEYIHDAESFYHIWSLKESFMKITGLGMKLPMDMFCVTDYDKKTGLCGYKYNRKHRSDNNASVAEDPAVSKHLAPFTAKDSDIFSVTGSCITYDGKYSLAVCASSHSIDYSLYKSLVSVKIPDISFT